jgi:hypothetical protein
MIFVIYSAGLRWSGLSLKLDSVAYKGNSGLVCVRAKSGLSFVDNENNSAASFRYYDGMCRPHRGGVFTALTVKVLAFAA